MTDATNRENYLYGLMDRAHVRAANRLGLTLANHGWVGTETGICSKTDEGYLTTRRREGRRYFHELEPYPARDARG